MGAPWQPARLSPACYSLVVHCLRLCVRVWAQQAKEASVEVVVVRVLCLQLLQPDVYDLTSQPPSRVLYSVAVIVTVVVVGVSVSVCGIVLTD